MDNSLAYLEKRAKWAQKQMRKLLAAGMDLVDAEAIVAKALDAVPPDGDPGTYVPAPGGAGIDAEITDDDMRRAKSAWMANEAVPNKWKLLLSAREQSG